MDAARKRWVSQEKSVAKKIKGRNTPGSGNRSLHPGDARSKKFLVSCKTTSKKSFSITEKMRSEIAEAAFFEKKVPLLFVTVNDTSKQKQSYWVISDRDVEIDENGNFKVVAE